MAVIANPKDSKLRLRLKVGTDPEGNDIIKAKTYSKVKSSATDENVVAVVNDLMSLQQYPMVGLVRVDEKELTQA